MVDGLPLGSPRDPLLELPEAGLDERLGLGVAVAAAPVLQKVLPDDAVHGFVQRLAGLALVGTHLEHVLPICLGGANGKSTMTSVIADWRIDKRESA